MTASALPDKNESYERRYDQTFHPQRVCVLVAVINS